MDIDLIAQKIISTSLFLKLKNVIENNSYHSNEPVYNHLLKTFEKAKQEINGTLIINPKAKEKYNAFVEEKIGYIKRKDLMQILALIHDIGKSVKPLIKLADGSTKAPNHEYEGSLIVKDVLTDTELPEEAIAFLEKGVRLHDAFNAFYQENKNLNSAEYIDAMKKRSEGMHIEETFNALCDCYSAVPFHDALPIIKQMFNDPYFYENSFI